MKNYRLLTIFFCVLFAAGISVSAWQKGKPALKTQETALCQSLMPNADRFVKESGPLTHYKAYRNNVLVGITYLTTDIVPEISGYGGPIKMVVGIDTSGTITGISIISHAETSAYAPSLGQFVLQFKDKNIRSRFRLGEDVNGITGATISSQAITSAVEKSLKTVGRQILKLDTKESTSKPLPLPLHQIFIPLAIFVAALAGLLRRNIIFRWIALAGGFVYLGLATHTMLSAVQIANILRLKFPNFHDSPLWYMLLGLSVIPAFIWGMTYCGNMCPFASVEEFLYNIRHKVNPKAKLALSRPLDRRSRYLKYGVLAAVLIISLIIGNSDAAGIEPFLTLFTGKAGFLGWALLALMLLLSFFNFRFWCKYLCPIGALNGLMSRFSLFKIYIGEGCDSCQACDRVCPTQAIRVEKNAMPLIDYPECILCGKCIQKCPKSIIKFKKCGYEKPG